MSGPSPTGVRLENQGECKDLHKPLHHFPQYLESHDHLHPVSSALWLTDRGRIPTHSFFMSRLCLFFQQDVVGQSMHAGGATCLAEHGIPPSIIQAAGQWASEAFLIYIQRNLMLGQLRTT